MATIRHPTLLALGQFHTVTLLRSLTQGSLIVGSLAPVNGTSQVRSHCPPPTSSPLPHLCPARLPSGLFYSPGQVPGSGPKRGALPGWLPRLRCHPQGRAEQWLRR